VPWGDCVGATTCLSVSDWLCTSGSEAAPWARASPARARRRGHRECRARSPAVMDRSCRARPAHVLDGQTDRRRSDSSGLLTRPKVGPFGGVSQGKQSCRLEGRQIMRRCPRDRHRMASLQRRSLGRPSPGFPTFGDIPKGRAI